MELMVISFLIVMMIICLPVLVIVAISLPGLIKDLYTEAIEQFSSLFKKS